MRWDGCVNVRDLGDAARRRRQTAFGVVVRADSIRALTDDGWQALADYGVRQAIDLRSDFDAADDPPGDLPIEVVRIPVNGNEVPVVAEWPSMQEAYAGLLDRFDTEFAGAVSAIARSDGPVVVPLPRRPRPHRARERAHSAAGGRRARCDRCRPRSE